MAGTTAEPHRHGCGSTTASAAASDTGIVPACIVAGALRGLSCELSIQAVELGQTRRERGHDVPMAALPILPPDVLA